MITSRKRLALICKQLKQAEKIIGFTSGAFDLVHGGHVAYLNETKKHCDVLIVGVNSDASIQAYKSPKRPIVPASERLALIDSLKVVDYSFIFEETNNHKNIELLKPHRYLKAGDYCDKTLSSAPLIESYGGQVKLLPFRPGLSTTNIIQKIVGLYGTAAVKGEKEIIAPATKIKTSPQPTVFLDRDGTINEEVEYLHQEEKFKLLAGALEGLSLMQRLGYRLALITTQAGIGLGYFTEEDFYRVNKVFLKACQTQGIVIDKIYYCPHSKSDGCPCRKPNIELFERAREDIPADLENSIMIGDKTSDIQAGKNAGLYSILVKTGHGGKDLEYQVQPDHVSENLIEAAVHLKKIGKVPSKGKNKKISKSPIE